MAWLTGLVLVSGALVLFAVGLSAYRAQRWSASTQALERKLDAARLDGGDAAPASQRYDAHELEGLPAPVQRYFRTVLTHGQPLIAAAEVELVGTFNLSATGAQWKPFSSRQRVVTRRPGFLWDAHVSLLPGLTVRVVDSYIAGTGALRAAALGLFTVAQADGGGEMARGELMRYFAEAAWYPTALLPSQGVRWAAVDAHSAHATMTDGPFTLTLLFRFDEAGLIASFRAEARGALQGKNMVMLPWEGSWSDYQLRGGMTVPSTGEVAWMRPEGRKQYFVGRVTALTYEFFP